MLVIHVAFECAPIYKTGGLGDVVGSLPKVFSELGVTSTIVLPKYGWINHPPLLPNSSIPVYYVDSPWFQKPNVHHNHKIQAPKYAHFAIQTLAELKRRNIKPDIIHCHDWHAALIPFLLRHQKDAFFEHTKTVLTIHNVAYQGIFPVRFLAHTETEVFITLLSHEQKRVSFLREGIKAADFITTVSPNHAAEIRQGSVSFGLKQVIRKKRGRFEGILNGIDYTVWNPETDHHIYERYNAASVFSGKSANKVKLQKALGLEVSPDIPLFGFVARLTAQKGVELLLPLLDEVPRRRIQIVILGAGERAYEQILKNLRKTIDHRWYAVEVKFDEKLAHQIYAGADFFLVPSMYEPCGLTQMIAMRYGTLPIVSAVGGLVDSVKDGVTGIVFNDRTTAGLTRAVERANTLWENNRGYMDTVEQALRKDFSWKRSAQKYLKLYKEVIREM